MEAQKFVWQGAIPLQIHLHNSEVTALPPPPPAFILAPRIGYLPLLIPLIKPYFATALPPGADTVWFDHKGLPLKWHIPTGVLFDLLCAEPERPWNLTVHFRGYPSNLLIPCEGEDSVKWSFINSLKEADYIVNGNCKNVMNMSHSDQVELWHSVMNGNMEAYVRASSNLKLGTIEDEFVLEKDTSLRNPRKRSGEADVAGENRAGKIPVRLYIWSVSEDVEEVEDIPAIDSWDKVSYINCPVEVHKEGKYFTLGDALKMLMPEFLGDKNESMGVGGEQEEEVGAKGISCEILLVRIQGIEPKLEIPFSWVVNNLRNPDHFVHICVCLKMSNTNSFDN